MDWLEISLTVSSEAEEIAASLLAQFAPGGVAAEYAEFEVLHEAEGVARPAAGPVTLRAYLPPDADFDALRAQVEAVLAASGFSAPTYRLVAESNWAEAWKAHFHPLAIGRRLMIIPAWLNPPLAPEQLPIRLDPGMAFGTGTHPTTQLCLEAIERYLKPGAAVLDLGTGSGILAIAAAKLGAGSMLAVDTDPLAVRVARENLLANGVTEQVRVECGSLAEILSGQFGMTETPLVVANILATVLIEMFAQGLARTVAPGGTLILSGILATQAPDVIAAFTAQGLTLVAQEQLGDWVAIVAQRGATN